MKFVQVHPIVLLPKASDFDSEHVKEKEKNILPAVVSSVRYVTVREPYGGVQGVLMRELRVPALTGSSTYGGIYSTSVLCTVLSAATFSPCMAGREITLLASYFPKSILLTRE